MDHQDLDSDDSVDNTESSEMECVNLKQPFGDGHRGRFEESYAADLGKGTRRGDPWLMILLCRHGHVFPWGGNTLAASVDGHPKVAALLRRLSCCRAVQDGDLGELTQERSAMPGRRGAVTAKRR